MNRLIKYTLGTLGTNLRPRISLDGGIYIWNEEQTEILEGPFTSVQQASAAKSTALDKALRLFNKKGTL